MTIKNLSIWWPKANCKWPYMQRLKCPIYNGTVYTVVSSTEICVCKHIENRLYSKIFRCALCISWTQNICPKMPLIVKKCSQFKQTFSNSTNTISPKLENKMPPIKKKTFWNSIKTFAPNRPKLWTWRMEIKLINWDVCVPKIIGGGDWGIFYGFQRKWILLARNCAL